MAYRDYLVETYSAVAEPSHEKIRVRALSGQLLPENINVRCSTTTRKLYPVGAIFKVTAKVTDNEGGKVFHRSP